MLVRFFVIIFVITSCSNVFADTDTYRDSRIGVSIVSGYGVARIVPLRLGLQKEFEKHWWTDRTWTISGYWEGSLYSMRGKRGSAPNSHKQLEAGALAGVFRLNRAERTAMGWHYIELGVGLSLLTQKEIGGRKLGTHFQFEDRFGIGVRFGENCEYDVGYKAIHFSNAYLGPINNGINLHVLMLGYWFK